MSAAAAADTGTGASTSTSTSTTRFILDDNPVALAGLNRTLKDICDDDSLMKRHTINTETLDYLLPKNAQNDTNRPSSTSTHPDTLDLDFLDDFGPRDSFLPRGPLLIRDCMRDVFGLFHLSDDNDGKAVFIGSPGVGKSILFFLAALFKARKKTVVFLRYTKESKYISVFLMQRCVHDNTGKSIDVVFTRSVGKSPVQHRITWLVLHITKLVLGSHNSRGYLSFVDGPNHKDDTDHRLGDAYNFFCTSGGFPPFKASQTLERRWILDAWRIEEVVQCLKLYKCNEDTAKKVYYLCGGSIRRMLEACADDNAFAVVQAELEDLINYAVANTNPVVLGFRLTDRGDALSLPDQLVSMFRSRHPHDAKRMRAIQLVDSEFVLSQLVKRANLSALKSVYDMSLELGDRTTQGMFYERLIHHWFQSSVPESTVPEDGYQYLGITAVVWSTGTGDEGLTELDSQGKYWIPSIPNFANIDAAVVRDGTLHAFQYTVRDKHDFTEETFTSFVQKVVQNVAGVAQNVKVHFISPTAPLSWNGRNDNSNTFDIVIPPQDRQTRSSLLQDSLFTVSFHFHQLKLDVKDVDAACRVCFKNCFQN